MKCALCGSEDTYVTESRKSKNQVERIRRRKCAQCGRAFTTYEYVKGTEDENKNDDCNIDNNITGNN